MTIRIDGDGPLRARRVREDARASPHRAVTCQGVPAPGKVLELLGS